MRRIISLLAMVALLVGVFVPTALAPNSFVSTAEAAPASFANLELKITGIETGEYTQEGLPADVSFEGSAGGPHIADGTVVGVDHAVFDSSGNAHLNVYLTITDKDGDQISANITGLAAPRNPGQYVLQETSGIIINEEDYATTGKYAHMVKKTFKDVGFITGFSFNPPAGSIHVKWYLV
jgi:hypothetical protein